MKNLYEKRIDQTKRTLASLGEIRTRPQFGGYGIVIDNIMFGLFLQSELYLRATQQTEAVFHQHQMTRLCYLRRGLPLTLSYYQLTGAIWQDPALFLHLATLALDGARQDHAEKQQRARLKGLPNISAHLESLLLQAGISSREQLKAQGAKACYLKLDTDEIPLSIKVLYALEGAVTGYHEAALPPEKRKELRHWYEARHPAAATKFRR
ncbi:MAG: TfoX/Sxy family DNA transformation protein [Yersiniaceae bacterium]|uniref:Competence-specific regulator n=1 Tax=Chimaeribacter coloradensis TaxID=2060068 RepID=A0A2N5ECR9_9GAMM|nr:TfoX/Sxy family DNA transformation protein [Chimaeribacter coloradensis]MDU6410819.1 TfoX/Sxy family DNA transformation protein [Yersiniaceae bacterium]PLR40318.1 competence-specific regulator [Chimaeribacter coloradensis]